MCNELSLTLAKNNDVMNIGNMSPISLVLSEAQILCLNFVFIKPRESICDNFSFKLAD